ERRRMPSPLRREPRETPGSLLRAGSASSSVPPNGRVSPCRANLMAAFLHRMPSHNIARVDFELSDEQRLLRDTVRELAREEIAPVAAELDRAKSFPYEIVARLRGTRAHGDPVPHRLRWGRRGHPGLRRRRRGAG